MKRIVRLAGREIIVEWKPDGDRIAAEFQEPGEQSRTRTVRVLEVESGVYSVLQGGRAFEIRLAKTALGTTVYAAGKALNVEVDDPRAVSSRRRGLGTDGRQTISAPMPGKVVRVLVEEGTEVEEGQGLVVVEAMKMQNEMKAPRAGKVIALAARAGASVSAGDVLVTLE